MNRMKAVVLLLGLLLASACGGSPPAGDAPAAASSAATTSPPVPGDSAPSADSPGGSFCSGFKANGGGLASIGPVPIFYPKEELIRSLEETLGVMKGLTPPAEIAEPWTTYRTFNTRLLAIARSLDAGQRLGGPPPGLDEVRPTDDRINAWIKANC